MLRRNSCSIESDRVIKSSVPSLERSSDGIDVAGDAPDFRSSSRYRRASSERACPARGRYFYFTGNRAYWRSLVQVTDGSKIQEPRPPPLPIISIRTGPEVNIKVSQSHRSGRLQTIHKPGRSEPKNARFVTREGRGGRPPILAREDGCPEKCGGRWGRRANVRGQAVGCGWRRAGRNVLS